MRRMAGHWSVQEERSFKVQTVMDQIVWEPSRWHWLSSALQSSYLGNGTLGLRVSSDTSNPSLRVNRGTSVLFADCRAPGQRKISSCGKVRSK